MRRRDSVEARATRSVASPPRAPELHVRRATAELASGDGAPGRRGGPLTSARAPELVWRAAPSAIATAVERRANVASDAVAGTGPSHAIAGDAGVPHDVRAALAPTLAPASSNVLDPALIDRLADDVIRRVERRVRIDRERRGL